MVFYVTSHFMYKIGGYLAGLYIKLYIKGQVSRSTAHPQTTVLSSKFEGFASSIKIRGLLRTNCT